MASSHNSEQPDYHVPVVEQNQAYIDSASERCPRCGSASILPAMQYSLHDMRLPRHMRVDICAVCGTRYRPALPPVKRLQPYELVLGLFLLGLLLVICVF